MDISQNQVQLPSDLANLYDLKKDVTPVVIIANVGRVEFAKLKKEKADEIIAKTGNKYLTPKQGNLNLAAEKAK